MKFSNLICNAHGNIVDSGAYVGLKFQKNCTLSRAGVKTVVAALVAVAFSGCAADGVKPYYHSDPTKYEQIAPLKRPVDYSTNVFITLTNKYGKVVVSRFGAQVISYVPSGGHDVLFMPENKDFTKGIEMHGGIPICWPWFSLAGGPMAKQHGFARYSDWTVEECYQGEDFSRLRLVLTSDEETKKLWPFDFRLTYSIELSERLAVRLITTNTADPKKDAGKWFEITEALHAYFRIGDIEQAVLRSTENYWTDSDSPSAKPDEVKGDLRLVPGSDCVYFTNWPGDYILFDDANNRKIAISARGNRNIVIWNPGAKKNANLGDGDYRHFVCIEPALANKWYPVRINPGRSHDISLTIFVKKEDK